MHFDYHVHTRYSADSRAPVIEQLRAAKKAGVTHICFTDHVDFDGVGLPPADIAARNAEIEALKGQFPDIDISFGMEFGMKDKAAYKDAYGHVKDCHMDFVIGSVHIVNGVDAYYPEYFEGRSREEAYLAYIEKDLECIRVSDFSVMGHYDFCAKHSPYAERSMSYSLAPQIFDEIFRELISRGKAFEVNTSAWRNDAPWGLDILRRYRELGGEYVTTGSDAHKPERVGNRLSEALDMIRAAGIPYVATFKNMEPIMHRI